ncbi:MAG: putative toxin-antitoxin system toxin component, PIN family [Candidatus Aminicenantes bacterium]
MSPDQVPKIVIDTNVFISAILFRSPTSRLVSLWQKNAISVLISSAVLKEYTRALAYPKFKLANTEIGGVVERELLPYVHPVKVKRSLNIVTEDPSDNKFLELAVTGKADYILSGDKHLLDLKNFRAIKIMTPAEFFGFFKNR